MSFSPDINLFRYKHANIFAHHDYGIMPGTPSVVYPGYYYVIFTPYGTDPVVDPPGSINWAQEPMVFPTLEAAFQFMPLGEINTFKTIKTELGIDYLELELLAVMNRLPPIDSLSSNFLNWRYGFGFGFSSAVWGWANGTAASSDEFIQRYSPPSALNLADLVTNVNGHNSGETYTYILNDLNTTPYESFVVSRSLVGAGSVSDSGERDEAMQQVLLSTEVQALNPMRDQVLWEGNWAAPNQTPTEVQSARTDVPVVDMPTPRTEGYTGDLLLFKANIRHLYDSSYGYVRQDLKERYKSTSIVTEQRNNYVDTMIQNLNNIIAATAFVPRGMRAKKQVSPRTARQDYTSLREELPTTAASDTMSLSTTTSTMGTSGGGGMGGGMGGGSY